MYVAKLPSTVSFSLRWMSEWMVVFFNGLFGWGQRERDTHRRAYMFVRHTIHIRWAVLILEEKCSDELMYLHEVDVPTTFQFQGHGTVRNAWTCEIFVQLRGTSWFARNRYILAMLPWLPAEFDPGVHLIWAKYGSQLCLHWLVNVLPFKTSKNWVDMYSQCVLCISFLCVCVCVCVWVFVRWVIPARFLSAWQDQHCDDFGVYGGLRGFKEQVPGLKTVAVGDMVGEYLRVGWRRYATMYIYIYYHWSYSRCQEVTPCHCQLPTIIKPG